MVELICGACGGRLLVETPGTTVACPHCGTLLETGPEPTSEMPSGTIVAGPDAGPPATSDVAAGVGPVDMPVPTAAAPAAELTEILHRTALVAAPSESVPDFLLSPVVGAADSSGTDLGRAVEPVTVPSESIPGEPVGAASAAEQAGAADLAALFGAAEQPPASAESAPPAATTFEQPVGVLAGTERHEAGSVPEGALERQLTEAVSGAPATGPSPLAFKLLVSYASAVTLACLYLLWQVRFLSTHSRTLDLPDLAPRFVNKKVSKLIYMPPGEEMPPANVMRLGETRQFGSLKVTPLRVARGPLEFVYYDPEKEINREPEGPVLKLFLRFENVSQDQEFSPLDSQLVFTKEPDRKTFGLFLTNNFVCRAGERTDRAHQVLVFDLAPDSQWLIKGQNLDRELKPGESVETFVATSPENLDSLSGDLLWRVHFRKGYNPQSFRGVTTLIEVRFPSSEIVDEQPLEAQQPAAAPEANGADKKPEEPEGPDV